MLLNRKSPMDTSVHRQNVEVLLDKINGAEAILVGAAAGMSASCGFNFFYQNDALFERYLGDFHRKYGFVGAFNGFYYHYPSPEAHWAFLARMAYMEYECPTGKPYYDLMRLLSGKNFHIMTTNQDFQFTRVVPEEKLSAIQGDSRYYQCSRRCHDAISKLSENLSREKAGGFGAGDWLAQSAH